MVAIYLWQESPRQLVSGVANVLLTLALLLCTPACGLVAVQDEPAQQDETMKLEVNGTVVDAAGRGVRDSMVIPLTSKGVPISTMSGKPMTVEVFEETNKKDFFVSTITDADGKFTLTIPPGDYRFVALHWLDHPTAKIPLAKNGSRLRLDGVADHLRFKDGMDAAIPFTIRPIGDSQVSLKITTSSVYLFFGTEPLAGDPALGFTAWTHPFPLGIIGATRVQGKQMLISGLPAGKIHFAAFANDNNPGFGGVAVTLGENDFQEVQIPIIASWSDGHKTPPDRLLPLVKHMQANPDDAKAIRAMVKAKLKPARDDADQQRPSLFTMSYILGQHLDDEVELSTGETKSFGDCLAAVCYARLQK